MDKVIISSLTADDFKKLSLIVPYLFKLKATKETFSVSTPCSKYKVIL